MPTPNPETILSPIQRDVLSAFGAVDGSGEFCLAGAAALSGFYLGHRRSQDVDLFTAADPLIEPVGRFLKESLSRAGMTCEVVRQFRTFLEMVARRSADVTRIQLAQDSPFRLDPPPRTYRNVRIDSFRDLAAGKLLAAFGRAEPRDLVDVYIMLRDGHCRFVDLVRWAREKDPGLDAYHLAQSLRTVEDFPAPPRALPVDMIVPLDVVEMKRVLLAEVPPLLDRGLPAGP